MQENRSFDHYFGTLRGVRGFGDPRPVAAAQRQAGLAPAGRHGHGVLPFHPDARRTWACSSSRTCRTAGTTATQAFNDGRYDQWVPAKSADARWRYLDPRGHPVPLRAGRRLHRLRRLPLLADRPRPTRTATTCGPATPATTARAAARSSPTTRPATTGPPTPSGWRRPGSPGRSTRTSATAWTPTAPGAGPTTPTSATTATTRCCTSTSTSNAAARRPALRQGAHRHRRHGTGEGFFDVLKADVQGGKLPQVSWIVAPEAFTEHPNWPANYGAWYVSQVLDALTADPEVWSKTALFITYDENDGFFDHVVPPSAASAAQGEFHRRRRPTSCSAGDAGYAAGPYGLGPAGADAGRLAVEQGRLGLLRGLRPHLDHPVHGAALRRARAEHLALAARGLRRPDHAPSTSAVPTRDGAGAARHRRVRPAGPRAPPRLRARPRRPSRRCRAGARPAPRPPAALRPGGGRPRHRRRR